ncbi:Ldh family oxidoreductase [Cohnella candidum]|uniref:Ldh family oxidoreductase n=1 Tax=Cohnella candidum TaxID=2674991 RepID=A0A3G3K3I3_9BACL|nr:Ldh family oxidoreductase [Cohnella candidum]AYQ75115.1 Ldh family oxidoreductase [Cohnella candidum]
MITVPVDSVRIFIEACLVRLGLEPLHAEISARHMAFADARGTDTHGIMQLPVYARRIRDGGINRSPNPVWEQETDQSAVLNGDHGMGHYSAHLAMEKAIEKARSHTISFVTIRNASHFGAASSYAKMASDAGMIGFVTSNAAALMAATGGTERVLGNNPICFAVPRKDRDPVILDMACSNVAMGKLVMAQNKGESIPLGWALDKNGNPTEDPYEGFQGGGSLVPIAGHKGYGLALIMDILAGVLSGSNYGKNVGRMADSAVPTGIGCSMIVLNLARILPPDLFGERLEDLLGMVLSSGKGANRIYLPGEKGADTARERQASGVPIPEALIAQLAGIADELGIDTQAYGF